MMKVFSALEGSWSFVRTVITSGVKDGKIEGLARFTRRGRQELFYKEEGTWTRASGETLSVSRTYVYALEDGKIVKYFDESPLRLFHVLEGENFVDYPFVAGGIHCCGEDRYEEVYNFTTSTQFERRVTVRGPQKNYSLTTIFQRKMEGETK